MIVRDADRADLEAARAIYAHAAERGLGTFEETAPPPEAFADRFAAVRASGLPWLVAESDGAIAGYAYAAPFRPRPAYRYTVEDSVYVAPTQAGRGIGKALLAAVIGRCEALGLRQMVALIGDSGNAGSIALHRACGFEPTGVLPAVGFKHDRWVDVVLMRRALAAGETRPPAGPGWAGADAP